MVEFRTMEYNPMDREYHQSASEVKEQIRLEEPIFPINQLGETVPEHDPTGRFKNIIQTTQAAIRGGAGTVQLVMQTPPESAIGGRPKAYGKEVRETLREVALASGVNIAGVEMPTALNNLAGFDYQQLVFSDEKRKSSLDEVKDAIKFVADVGGGGGVDLVSWEFPRGINEAPWQETDPLSKDKFHQEGEQPIGWLVDDRTGRTIQFRKTEKLHLPYDDKTFERFDPEKDRRQLTEFTWEHFQKWVKKENAQREQRGEAPITAEQLYIQKQFEGQINSMKGWETYYKYQAEDANKQLQQINTALQQADIAAEQKQQLEKEKARIVERRQDFLNSSYGQAQQAKELIERSDHLKPIKDYALARSTRTYAEAGIAAMQATIEGQAKGTVTKPLYVGPEIGWPGYYGSHPQEFIELVKESRKEFANLLTSATWKVKDPYDPTKITEKKNPHWDPTISKAKANELAEKHVKGLFDTSHMGMWLQHFKGKPGESEENRIKRFNGWYKEEVKKIADAGVVGGIQLVDSQSGAHGHLPPGEGIFPVIDAAKIFKEKGFSGFMVSEGHEEEKFGEGRIRTKLWQHAGAAVGGGYFSGPPLRWSGVQQGYFGKTYAPQFMFGSYSPSNEFRLWSEVPLE